jgi:hypothetical protein
VTWYRHAVGYRVDAELRPAGTQALAFRREDGALLIDLGELAEATVERIEVGWPARRLAELTLIDTPGLGSADTDSSARTTEALLAEEGDRPGEADAVIYLMRHLHRYDAQFLEAFIDRTWPASPINAIVVLSRADEIGAARPTPSTRRDRSPRGMPRIGGSGSSPRQSSRWPGSSPRPARPCANSR